MDAEKQNKNDLNKAPSPEPEKIKVDAEYFEAPDEEGGREGPSAGFAGAINPDDVRKQYEDAIKRMQNMQTGINRQSGPFSLGLRFVTLACCLFSALILVYLTGNTPLVLKLHNPGNTKSEMTGQMLKDMQGFYKIEGKPSDLKTFKDESVKSENVSNIKSFTMGGVLVHLSKKRLKNEKEFALRLEKIDEEEDIFILGKIKEAEIEGVFGSIPSDNLYFLGTKKSYDQHIAKWRNIWSYLTICANLLAFLCVFLGFRAMTKYFFSMLVLIPGGKKIVYGAHFLMAGASALFVFVCSLLVQSAYFFWFIGFFALFVIWVIFLWRRKGTFFDLSKMIQSP